MSDFIPNKIINHLSEASSAFKGIFFISTDEEGRIETWAGDHSNYLKKQLSRGVLVNDLFPFLTGMIAVGQDKIHLPHVHIYRDKYVDVHILKGDNASVWFVFTDTTLQAENLKDLLQEVNERRINQEKEKKPSEYENPFGHIELLHVATFEKRKNYYLTVGEQPQWVSELISEINKKGAKLDLVSIFPFLEVFEKEAAAFWGKEEHGLFKSGVWTQGGPEGEDYLLRAFAARKEGKRFLLIWPFSEYLSYEEDIIQTAREQELAYEKLAKTEARLKELLEYKEKFVSIISHDLRSPIASVLGASEMLLNDESLKEKLDEFNRGVLSDIKDEMSRLLDYNAKLYHWSNLELGNFKLVLEEITVAELIKIVEQTEQQRLKQKNISFNKNIEKGLSVKVDITLFLQALNNLVSNAVKFTPENGSITVEAHPEAESGKIYISVTDTGVGMTEETKQTLFSKHTTSHGTSGEKGSGLGLGIVKKVTDAHGFSLVVESEKDKGSSFKIII